MWKLKSFAVLEVLLWTTGVLAAAVANVGDSLKLSATGLPDPWVSIIASGVQTTVTPVITTVSGTPITLNAFPSPTIPTSIGVIPDATATSPSTPTATGIGAFEICHNVDGQFVPLCPMPNNNTLYIMETYYVTWDTSYYTSPNATVRVIANYYNATGGGPQAFESDETLNSWGFVSLNIEKAWLQGLSSNNLTLFITSLLSTPQGMHQTAFIQGPTITITSRPYQPYTPNAPTKAPSGKDLFIALPTVAAFILLVVCGGCLVNRKHRYIGLGNIMSRNRGYRPGSKKNRNQRMDELGSRRGDIVLHDHPGVYRDSSMDWIGEDPFTDRPGTGVGTKLPEFKRHHSRSASEGLGSLAGSPIQERNRNASWSRPASPTRTKAVGDSGFVKEEVQIIERIASGSIRPSSADGIAKGSNLV